MFVLCCHYRVLFYHLSFHCSARKKKANDQTEQDDSDYCQRRKGRQMVASFVRRSSAAHAHAHAHTLSCAHTHTHTHMRIHTRTDKASHSEATHACISEACGHVGLGSRVLGGGKEVKEQEGSAIGGGRGDKG